MAIAVSNLLDNNSDTVLTFWGTDTTQLLSTLTPNRDGNLIYVPPTSAESTALAANAPLTETFEYFMTDGNLTLGATTVTLDVTPGLPVVSVFAESDGDLSEYLESPGTFIFQLSEPAPAGGLVVSFQTNDTALDGSVDVTVGDEGTTNIENFVVNPATGIPFGVLITPGATEARLVVTPFPDGQVEPAEVIALELLAGNYLIDPVNSLAELTVIDGVVDAANGPQTTPIIPSQTITVNNFTGVGQGGKVPSDAVLEELDIVQFEGEGLTARNLQLAQIDDDVLLSFEGFPGTQIRFTDLALDAIDNIPSGWGNLQFTGETALTDSFDVFNSDSTQTQLFNANSVTFLNALNNTVEGFDDSDDVINGQAGNDLIEGLSGDDLLRGGDGNDSLSGGLGADIVAGNTGDDLLDVGADTDVDVVVYRNGDGSDRVLNFTFGADGDLLTLAGIDAVDLVEQSGSTLLRQSDGIAGNDGFGSGATLLEFVGLTGLTPSVLNLNLTTFTEVLVA